MLRCIFCLNPMTVKMMVMKNTKKSIYSSFVSSLFLLQEKILMNLKWMRAKTIDWTAPKAFWISLTMNSPTASLPRSQLLHKPAPTANEKESLITSNSGTNTCKNKSTLLNLRISDIALSRFFMLSVGFNDLKKFPDSVNVLVMDRRTNTWTDVKMTSNSNFCIMYTLQMTEENSLNLLVV